MRGTSLAAAASSSPPAPAAARWRARGPPARHRGQRRQPSAITPGGPAASHPSAAWPEFDQNAQRTGIAPGLPTAGKLTLAWTASLDGAVYGQPLVVGGDVIAATENDSVYAISRATGKTVWRAHVGTPVPQSALHGCGDIFPLGITGTPALRPGRRAGLRGGGDDRLPARAVRALGRRRQGRGQDATSTSRPRRTSPPRTSSARPSRSTTAGSTPRSAGWRATAAPTSAASSGSTSTARARW